jgi:hypothetical protein
MGVSLLSVASPRNTVPPALPPREHTVNPALIEERKNKNMSDNTEVRVMKRNAHGWSQIHRGIVVSQNDSFLKFYNEDDPYDASPLTAEWFARDSEMIRCEPL